MSAQGSKKRRWVCYRLFEQYDNSKPAVIDFEATKISIEQPVDVFAFKDRIVETRNEDAKIPRSSALSVFQRTNANGQGEGKLELEDSLSQYGKDSKSPLMVIIHRTRPTAEGARSGVGGGGDGGHPGGGGGSGGQAGDGGGGQIDKCAGFLYLVTKFVESIRANAYKRTNCTLTIENGVVWPCATNSSLFVRKYYDPLYENVFNRFVRASPPKKQSYVLTGQPGVGKSVFAWYAIFRVLTDQTLVDHTIVYVHEDLAGSAIIINPKRTGGAMDVFVLPIIQLTSGTVNEMKAILIVDTVPPPFLNCPTLWVISPGSLQSSQSKTARNRMPRNLLYMPLYTQAEILEMNDTTMKDLKFTHDAVLARVALWGPVPRLVFFADTVQEQEEEVQSLKALTTTQIQNAFECIVVSAGDGKNPQHRLFLERAEGQDLVDPDGSELMSPAFYKRGTPTVASIPIRQWLLIEMQSCKYLQKAEFIVRSSGVGEDGAKRGTLFEELSLKVLEKGGKFEVRNLSNNSVTDWTLKAQKLVQWDKGTNLSKVAKKGTILVPNVRNEVGLDAIIWVPHLEHHVPIDFTVSKRHGIHQQGLNATLGRLGTMGWSEKQGWTQREKELQYIWIVPEDKFDCWTKPQAPKTGKLHSGVNKYLHQFALKMPYSQLFAVIDSSTDVIDQAFANIVSTTESSVQKKRRRRGNSST